MPADAGEADADDVADGIDRADFVEVHLFDIDAVTAASASASTWKTRSLGLHGIGQIGGRESFSGCR
jgi:hypothetical protein